MWQITLWTMAKDPGTARDLSKQQFHAKLNDPRIGCGANHAKVGSAERSAGRSEVRVIKAVEKPVSELKSDPLLDVGNLGKREIEIDNTRRADVRQIARRISEGERRRL